MSQKKDVLSIWKKCIINESRHGDKKKACDAAGTTSTTYLTAMKKDKLEDLTDGELNTLTELISIIDERKQKLNRINQRYATK